MTEPVAIGEFARRSGLTVSTLRFYDECGLLHPHRVDPSSGYRSYLEGQLDTALLIRNLRALGMPIAEVRRVLGSAPSELRDAVEARVRTEVSRLAQVRATAQEVTRQINEMENVMKMVVAGKALMEGTRAVARMASSDPERPVLGGLQLEARDGSLRLVATDGYRLGLRDIPALGGAQAEFRGVVSAPAFLECAERPDPQSEVAVEVKDGLLIIEAGARMELPLMEGQYPAYETILSVRGDAFPAILPAGEFEAAIERSREDDIRLSFERSLVTVLGSEPTALPASYDGPEMELCMERRFLEDALEATAGPDLAIEVSDPLAAVWFRSADDVTSVTLVMPKQPKDS